MLLKRRRILRAGCTGLYVSSRWPIWQSNTGWLCWSHSSGNIHRLQSWLSNSSSSLLFIISWHSSSSSRRTFNISQSGLVLSQGHNYGPLRWLLVCCSPCRVSNSGRTTLFIISNCNRVIINSHSSTEILPWPASTDTHASFVEKYFLAPPT